MIERGTDDAYEQDVHVIDDQSVQDTKLSAIPEHRQPLTDRELLLMVADNIEFWLAVSNDPTGLRPMAASDESVLREIAERQT